MKKLCCVVGARPNYMKIAPILRSLKKYDTSISSILVHTGQHYDEAMNEAFFRDLDIPRPDIHLEVGSRSHAVQTAEIMIRFEQVLDEQRPDAILVVGDVNSTIACALVAVKKNIRIIHVEAGLRSFDRRMPEEINRILTDQISDILFTTEKAAEKNLVAEGVSPDKIHFVGNVMIDTLYHTVSMTDNVDQIMERHKIRFQEGHDKYGLVTLHRPSNVDNPEILLKLLNTINLVAEKLPILFPMHPRTSRKIRDFGLADVLEAETVFTLNPLGYKELLALMKSATFVLTDSGGIQEETTALGIPCITLRNTTERPITLTEGTNTLVGSDRKKIISAVNDILTNGGKTGQIPEAWDGHAADRIVNILHRWL